MKHIYMLFAVLTISSTALSQLSNGSIAPDFTATDINGVEYNLYDLLDGGNTVILDFYATWCGPCWSYKETGILEDLWNTFGPDGTGDLYVFSLESDDTTTDADLHGTGPATTGDWVTGTPFPMFDNMSNVFDDYQNSYYPTIYTVCPDPVDGGYALVESGQASFDGHVAAAFMDCSNSITGAAPLVSYNGETSSCGGDAWNASAAVTNLGSEDVTAMTFSTSLNGVAQSDITWEGVLSNGGNQTVDLGSYTEIGTFDYTLIAVNGADWNAEDAVSIVGSTEATSYVQVRIHTDNWPEETSWEILDSDGMYIDGIAEGSLDNQNDMEFTWDVALDLNECYVFTIYDAYGDGLNSSQWGASPDGTCDVVSMDGTTEVSIVVSYDGATDADFAELVAGMEVTQVTGITENDLTSSVNVFPNPFTDNTTLSFSAAEAGQASVVVYNLVGKKVIEMNLGNIAAGTQTFELDFASMEAGIYLVSLTAGNETSTLRVTNAQ
ncbi:MAG TPA: T9SS type A sorting domain-containing protein [Flavobacteriales bacterium]|nr:T9SS type A sorting domain-containing protein [Flavobacteriales bacterium]